MKSCPHCQNNGLIIHGKFYRKDTHSVVKRYKCKACGKTSSSRTRAIDRYQKKSHLNNMIAKLLCNRGTLRGIADSLGVSYSTVVRKFYWLAEHNKNPRRCGNFTKLWFDEMETFEHSKLRPLGVALAVDENYKIQQAIVGSLPAKGHLASISLKKYGYRENESNKICQLALSRIALYANPQEIYTDKKTSYRSIIKKQFKHCRHIQILSEKNESIEQRYGQKKFQHLFPVNQRSGQLRDKISRLTRRSWITTKKAENLQKHLDIFIAYQNGCLVS